MKLEKTEKGRDELHGSCRNLGRRERTLLILADGHKTVQDIELILKDDTRPLAEALIRDGYLVGINLTPPETMSARRKPDAPVGHADTSTATISEPVTSAVSEPHPATAADSAFNPTITQSFQAIQKVNADSFEGKRSLATTRMFLFDICERMFARRSPAQAEVFRDALRAAKDRDSMLAAAREMMEAIEQVAGSARADSISERIAMLLPVEG